MIKEMSNLTSFFHIVEDNGNSRFYILFLSYVNYSTNYILGRI
nr:MAG TPA: hypothetical protein [Caudoviricetes sp.]